MKSFYWLCSSCAFGLSVWFLRAVAITLQCLIEHRKTILSQVIAANIREGEILTSQWKHNENIRNLIIEKAREKTRTTESRWGSFFNWFRRWHELCANERGRQINFSNNFFFNTCFIQNAKPDPTTEFQRHISWLWAPQILLSPIYSQGTSMQFELW